jgi:hypothetical protein
LFFLFFFFCLLFLVFPLSHNTHALSPPPVLWLVPGVRYAGVACSTGKAGKPRPMWIFERIDQKRDEDTRQAESDLRAQFPDIHAEAHRLIDSERAPAI